MRPVAPSFFHNLSILSHLTAVGPREDALQLFPTRIVPLADGGSAFTVTMFQGPGQPDEQFECQYHSLLREFENLERLFG